ncbi:MAG: 16S rRNA (guanine(527)-N(7))-methyltransferase RsmG [Bacillota bacterium]|nr:16S rRNA (guanine(527)-N(7))-methyltransferase RsmG [Bacillota bacterium]
MDEQRRSFGEWIEIIAHRSGQSISADQRDQLIDFVMLLRTWNGQINLTAVTDDEGIAIKHLLDSLTVLPLLDETASGQQGGTLSLVDVGTGAGVPGLLLKIMRPDWHCILMDALAKRLRFLDAVIAQLGLEQITTWHGRAEDAGRLPAMRDRHALVVARAVAPLHVLAELCLPLVRVNGRFVAMKGNPDSEWPQAGRAVRLLGGELESLQQFTLPGTDMQRSLFCIRKRQPTPAIYPRKAGKPEKQPL